MAYRDRKRGLSHEGDNPGSSIEVQDLSQDQTVTTLKIGIEDRVDTKINGLKDEMVALRKQMEKMEEKIIAKQGEI